MFSLPHLYKSLAAGLLAIAFFVILVQPAWAKDFQADYVVDYTLDTTNQVMKVKQQISLTNKQPNLRASSYSLTLESNSYKNLKAYDSRGALAFTEKDANGAPTITFTFNDKVVGAGNKLQWTIEYDSTSLAKKNGQMWDISIPRIKPHDSYDIASYKANLITPVDLEEAHYMTPGTNSVTTSGSNRIYAFTKDQIMPAGIIAAFGQAQVFKFTLLYHLNNPNIGQASTEIALPPDIPGYQQIIYDQLDPQPVKMRTDQDGNTLATYYLGPSANLDVAFTGWARIDQKKVALDSTELASSLPPELVKNYTVYQKYWETDNDTLKSKVDEITDPNKPVIENARAIYDYVTQTLNYNTARIDENLARMGAAAAMNEPDNAVCMEFTDLFITMARIAGIPAREIDGYAYTTGKDAQPIYYPEIGSDILHAWAQIYLPGDGWVMVDPTWGSTTDGIDFFGQIDLNRVAFAIKGLSSQTPYAAGAYKTSAEQDGDVTVAFSDTDQTGLPKLTTALNNPVLSASFGQAPNLAVTNTGNTTAYNVHLKTASQGNTSQPIDHQQSRLLPGETITVSIKNINNSLFADQQIKVITTTTATDFYQQDITDQQSFDIEVASIFKSTIAPILVVMTVILITIGGVWYGLHWLHDRREKQLSQPDKPQLVQDPKLQHHS